MIRDPIKLHCPGCGAPLRADLPAIDDNVILHRFTTTCLGAEGPFNGQHHVQVQLEKNESATAPSGRPRLSIEVTGWV